jgi:hypothetical protein
VKDNKNTKDSDSFGGERERRESKERQENEEVEVF